MSKILIKERADEFKAAIERPPACAAFVTSLVSWWKHGNNDNTMMFVHGAAMFAQDNEQAAELFFGTFCAIVEDSVSIRFLIR